MCHSVTVPVLIQLQSRPWNFSIGHFILQSFAVSVAPGLLASLSSKLVLVMVSWLTSLCLDKGLLPRSVELPPREQRDLFKGGNIELHVSTSSIYQRFYGER